MAVNTGPKVKGFRATRVSLESHFAAFDSLPLSIRRALINANGNWASTSVATLYRRVGEAKTLAAIAALERKYTAALRAEQETAIVQLDAARLLSDLGL